MFVQQTIVSLILRKVDDWEGTCGIDLKTCESLLSKQRQKPK